MTNNQTNNVTAEEIQEKKHKLLAWLKELVSIFKSPACFEALKGVKKTLNCLPRTTQLLPKPLIIFLTLLQN